MPMATSSSTMHYKPLCNILSNHCAMSSFHYFDVTCAPNPNGCYFLSLVPSMYVKPHNYPTILGIISYPIDDASFFNCMASPHGCDGEDSRLHLVILHKYGNGKER